MSTDPPSYQPKRVPLPRPDSSQTRPVGDDRPAAQPPTRQMPADPPSYAPGGGRQAEPPAVPPQRYAPEPRAYPEPIHDEPPLPKQRTKRRKRGKKVSLTLAFVLVLLLAWPIGLAFWANSKLRHIDALSGASNTSGTTYLLAGSDSRADLEKGDPGFDQTEGARTDTILLLHVPEDGTTSLISLPRDSYVEIPGHGSSKLNAAYALGGPQLLVESVENLSGFTVDHYVEVGFSGITNIVDELDGIRLCYDEDVNDKRSKLKWKAGCHVTDGETALAFARMRYADKEGDIGRTNRQRQLIGAITAAATESQMILNPARQVGFVNAATGSLAVDHDTNVIDLAKLALAFRRATGPEGWSGTPPIASLNYRPGGVGSAVQLDGEALPGFFRDVAAGEPPAEDSSTGN